MSLLGKILAAAILSLLIFYIIYAGKIQRQRTIRMNALYNQGAITINKYEKMRNENTFLNALFNPN